MRFDARTRQMFAAPMDPSRCLTSKRRLTDWSGKPPLTRRNECSHVTPAAPNGDQWSGLASVVTIAFKDGLSLAARCSRRISIRLGWFGSAPGGLAHVNPLLKFPAGRRAIASVAARQVKRRHLILVIPLNGEHASPTIGDVHFGVRRRSSTRSSPSASISANTP